MLIINLYGQPGAGKSTTRADVFSRLKRAGVNCEEVYEHAKKLTWLKRHLELSCQPYVLGKQLRDFEILRGQVDVIVTDSPLLLSYFYGKKYCQDAYPDSFYQFVAEQAQRMPAMNFYLNRTKAYNPIGRNQTEAESDEIADELLDMLKTLDVDYQVLDGDINAGQNIADAVLAYLNGVPA